MQSFSAIFRRVSFSTATGDSTQNPVNERNGDVTPVVGRKRWRLLACSRAYSLRGDTARAHAAYQDFLNFWKDADPDIPILKQAKAEYTKLQQVPGFQ
jgi:hypothetical protein